MRPEGPFGDHTGFYTAVEDYPVFHLTAITHRRDAIYPTTIVGPPPMEDFYMGDATVRIFLPVFKMNFPELVDMTLPPEGVFHNLVFVSIRKQYPYQAFKVMHGLWGMGQMMFSKYIVVVDEDCDVHNTSEVLFRLCANTDPERDSTIIRIQAIHSITRLPSRTLGLTWALMPHANCRAKIITAPGRSCSRWMSASRRLVDSLRKNRVNCTPNQKCLRSAERRPTIARSKAFGMGRNGIRFPVCAPAALHSA
jgi:hypothetical protein